MTGGRPGSLRGYWEAIAGGGTWAGYYDAPPDVRTYNFFTRRESVVRLLAGDGGYRRVLDVGCGTADYAPVAARHRAAYFGVDYAIAMIAQAARRTAGDAGPRHFTVAGGEALPFRADSFDLVLALGYIEYFADPGPALAELRRVMSPGGVLVMQSFKWDLLGRARRACERLLGRAAPPAAALPPDWVDEKYSGRQLDRLAARFDLERADHTFSNFHLLPEALRRRWPRLYMALSDAAGRTAPRLLGCSAVNYVGKYTLRKAAG